MDDLMSTLVFMLILAIIPAVIAKHKGRNFFTWYVYGYFLWLIALVHSIVMSKTKELREQELLDSLEYVRCPHCLEIIRNGASICPHCQKRLDEKD